LSYLFPAYDVYSRTGHRIDPRSAEFREVLARISLALKFMADHPSIRDHDQYLSWLRQLQRRANSLVAKVLCCAVLSCPVLFCAVV
jgi:hypothetical protein